MNEPYRGPKLFVATASVCIIILALIYLIHSVYAVSLLGYGHIGQVIGGYFLVGPDYYKPAETISDDMGDEEELALIDQDHEAEDETRV